MAVWLGRSPELVIATLAALKTGAAYVPLDPEYPVERVAFMLRDARPLRVVTSTALARRVQMAAEIAICLDTPATVASLTASPMSALADADRLTPLRPHHAAYVIYTSGSTGLPKGVVVTHQSIAHYLDVVRVLRSVRGPTRMPLFTAPVFDLTLTTLFAPLLKGGQLEIVGDGHPAEALDAIFGPSTTQQPSN